MTRAGNNDWHATAFDYLRARRRDTQRPRLFFFSHEGLRLLLPETATGNFYTAAARAHVMVAYSDPPSFDSYSLPIDYNDQPDLVASRRFRLSEHFSLYFRAEYFNIFNHPMFAPPSANFNNQFSP